MECVNGVQSKTVSYIGENCPEPTQITRDCEQNISECESDFVYGDWSECEVDYNFDDLLNNAGGLKGRQSRVYDDLNNCIDASYEFQDCSDIAFSVIGTVSDSVRNWDGFGQSRHPLPGRYARRWDVDRRRRFGFHRIRNRRDVAVC